MKVLIIDPNGMVGHVVKRYFVEKDHEVAGFDDTSDFAALQELICYEAYDAVINCSAVINQNAEADKVSAVRINSLLPHFLEAVTAGTRTAVVHRSTDCIFSGEEGGYTLASWPDAKSFYARSKALGELENEKDITIRTSLIGPETDPQGGGLFNWFYHQRGDLNGFANAIWTGITTIEFAKEIEWLLSNKKSGVFQLVPDHPISKYELLLLFEKYYPGDRNIIRVENKRVDKSLLRAAGGMIIPDYETQIKQMKQWTDNHRDLYSY